jgi:hypothetical protein
MGISRLYCGGDLVGSGQHPNEVSALIQQRAVPPTYGTHDYAVARDLMDCERRSTLRSRRRFGQSGREYQRPRRGHAAPGTTASPSRTVRLVTERGNGNPGALSDQETARVRRRVRLMVEITSRVGAYRAGLSLAARRLTPAEAAIIADLERHGLDVPQLRDVLCGGHVLVDDPELYERWRFPKTRERLSSHHKRIDKGRYPDLGLKGPLVREKLHGRTEAGTWVQLEKTPAAVGQGLRLPTFTDALHLWDYLVYRFTKSNVGPWGLSKKTERRPLYLSPSLSATVPLSPAAKAELTSALQRIEDSDDTTSASPDLARRFPPPDRGNTFAELVFRPASRNGRGLFGSSDVYVTEAPSPAARALMAQVRAAKPGWSLPDAGRTAPATLPAGEREVQTVVRRVPVAEQPERT